MDAKALAAVASSFRAMAELYEKQAVRLENITHNLADAAEAEAPIAKKRRARQKRDPNRPKRPKSAYLLFADDARKKLREQGENMSDVKNVMKSIGEMWRQTAAEERKPYEADAKVLKEQYEKDLARYHADAADGNEDTAASDRQPAKRARTASATSHEASEVASLQGASADSEDEYVPADDADSPVAPRRAAAASQDEDADEAPRTSKKQKRHKKHKKHKKRKDRDSVDEV